MTNKDNTISKDFFLTPEEYYRKRANIIEELKKCSIEIGYHNNVNSIKDNGTTKGKKTYDINIQTPVDPSIPKKTAVYHELSHALWDSFVSGSIDILKQWSFETMQRLLREKKIPNGANEAGKIPKHLSSEVLNAQAKVQQFINSIYMNCFNALEDQRIESLTRNVWLATKGMFKSCTTKCGMEMDTGNMRTPSDHILAARFHRPELTTPEYRQAVIDVEGTGMTGAIVVMNKMRALIDKHIEENLKKPLDTMKKVIHEGGCLPIPIELVNQYQEKVESKRKQIGNTGSYEARISRYENAVKESDMTTEQKAEKKKEIAKMRKISGKAKSPVPKTEKDKKLEAQVKAQEEQKLNTNRITVELEGETNSENTSRKNAIGQHSIQSAGTPSYIDKKMVESILGTSLEESKKQAKKEVNKILEKILVSGSPKEPAHIKVGLTRMTSSVQPDTNIANQLAKTFERVRQSKRTKLTETGNELDIEALIQTHSKGFGEYMIEEVRHQGLTIYISIDGSGSMRHMNHMGEARNLVATMFKAVDRTPSVKILANVWSSNPQGEVGITTVKSLQECKQISLDNKGYYYTPTHEAIRYTAKQMGSYSGKKLMIIITDGLPQYHGKNGQSYSSEVLVNMAQKEYRKAQKYCRNIMCINISQEQRAKQNLQAIFKRNYVEFNGMIQPKQFVLKNFRRTVFDTLRR